MQLREIHIEGFGIFHDKHITGLSAGINVVHGPNEFGKSTLLAFIRRILFGFPRSSSNINPYPALEGGAYGGRLVCKLSDGRIIGISRKEGPHRGPVKISVDSKESTGQEELNKILGRITEKFYENVYAIGLDELERLASLEEDEVKSHIYGAGLGLGNISLKDIKDEFAKRAEAVFKQGGYAQEMPRLYKEIRELEKSIKGMQYELSEYDELVKQRDKLIEAVNSLNDQIRTLGENQRKLENQKKLFPTYIALVTAESELSELQETPLFNQEALRKLEQLKKAIADIEKQIEDEIADLKDLEFQRGRLIYDEKIIELEQYIIDLQRKSEQFRSASENIEQVKSERSDLKSVIEDKIATLGLGWAEESVRNFNLSLSQEDIIRTTKARLEEARRIIDIASSKLEVHREQKAADLSKGLATPPLLRYTAYVITALGLIGLILGFIFSQQLLSVIPAIVFVTGIILIINMRNSKKFLLPDQLEKKHTDNLSVAESDYKKILDKWHEFLKGINFDEILYPDSALEVVRQIKGIKSDFKLLDDRGKRIGQMEKFIKSVKELHDQIATCLNKSKISNDIAANIEIFAQLLNTAKEAKREKEDLEGQIAKLNTKIEGINDKKRQAEEELQIYISSLGAKDEDDFRLKYKIFERSEELKGTINESKKIIRTTVGMGEYYDRFIESLSSITPDEIDSNLEVINTKLEGPEGLKADRDNKNQKIGELRNEIDRLSSTSDLLIKQSEVETKKQQLCDSATDWVRAQIALFVLKTAVSKYENTRQPEVIKAAKDIFADVTNQAYSMIIKPAETDEFKIQDSLGKPKTISEMSRGTKEQLYFAMRLGLIKIYEARSEPMPIIMDDILVNFDDDRGPLAIKALAEFSHNRQVIVLTCHKNTLDLYRSLGAKEITFV